MKKLIKIVLGIVVVAVVLLIGAIAAFVVFFDPNSFRSQIAAQVKTATGRDLQIGDIQLSVFPTLGARVKNVTFGNAAGFGETPFASIGDAEVGMKIVPLVRSRAVEVNSLRLDGLTLNLVKNADGKSNWDDLAALSKQPGSSAPSSAQPEAAAGPGIKSIDIVGIRIGDAALNYRDDQAHKSYALSKLNLNTGAIRPGKPFDFDLSFATQLTQPAITAETEISAKLAFDLAAKSYQAQKLKLKLTASGQTIPQGRQSAELDADLSYDGSKGALSLSNAKLEAAGLDATASFSGSGLNGSDGRFSGPLAIKPFSPRDILKNFGMSLDTADPDALKTASVSAQIEGSSTAVRLSDLKLELDHTHLSGSVGIDSFTTQAVEFALKADQLDADRYLPPPANQPAATPAASKSNNAPPAPPGAGDATVLPVDALEKLNASGTLDVGKFKLQNLSMTDVDLKIAAPKGREKRVDLAAKLYGGTISNTTRITPGARPGYVETLKLAGINAGPLLLDLTGKDRLDGIGDVSANLNGSGRTVGELKHALDGDVSISFKNGKIKGFNLGAMLRKGEAFIKGQQIDQNDPPETDFTRLSASGKIVNGVLTSNDLNALSPLFRVSGAGQVDIANQTINYVARPTVVNTASGQGGKELANLEGVVIPIDVTGTFSAPRYSLDIKEAAQQKAATKLTQKIDDQIDKRIGGSNPDLANKLKQGLGALFGKKSKPADNPAPQNPPPTP